MIKCDIIKRENKKFFRVYKGDDLRITTENWKGLKITDLGYEHPSTMRYVQIVDYNSGNNIEYSIANGITWNNYISSIYFAYIGSSIYFRRTQTKDYSLSNYINFKSSVECSISGNIMSMIDKDNFENLTELIYEHSFTRMFYNSTNIIDISKLRLPTIILSKACYTEMFEGCTGLISIPTNIFPINSTNKLSLYSHQHMFYGCTNLIDISNLILSCSLNEYCYQSMFYGCTNLIKGLKIIIDDTSYYIDV